MVSFFICWLPFHAQRLLASYLVKDENQNQFLLETYRMLTYISGVMYYLSSTINPLLYQLMSAKFRLAFKETFKCTLFRCATFRRLSQQPHLQQNRPSIQHHHTLNASSHRATPRQSQNPICSPSNSIRANHHKPPVSPCLASNYSAFGEPSESLSCQIQQFSIPIDGSTCCSTQTEGLVRDSGCASIRVFARRFSRPLMDFVARNSLRPRCSEGSVVDEYQCCCQLNSDCVAPTKVGMDEPTEATNEFSGSETEPDDSREPARASLCPKGPLLKRNSSSNLNDGSSRRGCLTRVSSRSDENEDECDHQGARKEKQETVSEISENLDPKPEDRLQFERLIQPFQNTNEASGPKSDEASGSISASSENPSSSGSRSTSASSPIQLNHQLHQSRYLKPMTLAARLVLPEATRINEIYLDPYKFDKADDMERLNDSTNKIKRIHEPMRLRNTGHRRNSCQYPNAIENEQTSMVTTSDPKGKSDQITPVSCTSKRRKFSNDSSRYAQTSSSIESSTERPFDDKWKLSHSSTTSAIDCTSYTTTNSHLTGVTANTSSSPQLNSIVGSLSQSDCCPLNGLETSEANLMSSIVINPLPAIKAAEIDELGVPLLASQEF